MSCGPAGHRLGHAGRTSRPTLSHPPVAGYSRPITTDDQTDGPGGFYVETLVLSAALWWGLWRTGSRLSHRFG
jgi:hypothetical protein